MIFSFSFARRIWGGLFSSTPIIYRRRIYLPFFRYFKDTISPLKLSSYLRYFIGRKMRRPHVLPIISSSPATVLHSFVKLFSIFLVILCLVFFPILFGTFVRTEHFAIFRSPKAPLTMPTNLRTIRPENHTSSGPVCRVLLSKF